MKDWRAKNKERRQAYKAQYEAANGEQHLATRRAYYAKNREKITAQARANTTPEKAAARAVYAKQWREENLSNKRVADAEYYLGHREKIRARAAKWYEDNKERASEYHKKRYLQQGDEIRARVRAYNAADPERKAQRAKKYREENREKIAAHKSKWGMETRAARTAAFNKWRTENPEKFAAVLANRSARERGAEGLHTHEEWQAVIEGQNGKCNLCGVKRKLERDHIVSIAVGGSNYSDNIQGLCRSCNARKHAKDWEAVVQEHTARSASSLVMTPFET
jgi:5-methylcytosine-specific restriction endonuclease McrA